MEHHVLRRKSGFSKQLDSGINHTRNMHPYLMVSLLITSCLGGYFGEVDTGIVVLNCQNYNEVAVGYSATDDDKNCHVVFEQDYNRSESRKQAATEERKDEDNDSKPELPKKV